MGPTDHECRRHRSAAPFASIGRRQHGDHVRTGRFSNSILDFLELYATANLHLPIYTSKIRVAFLTDVASKVSSSVPPSSACSKNRSAVMSGAFQ